ncbi:hypothetical protein K9M74_00045 [Candidatus Woesearchaeota archaeon]|nr:hypothetical protein [Candidatus Woesearchaeota archaeon]
MSKKAPLWYESLGYAYNPFIIKPGFFDDEVVGYDKEIDNLVTKLTSPVMYFLEGDFGLGKTTMLRYVINEFAGQKKVLYISRNRSDRAFDYAQLLKGANKGLGKLLGKKAKDVILVVDETAKINAADCEQIVEYFESGNFLSVLFVDKSFKEARLSDEIRKIIGQHVMSLKQLKAEDAIELARSRLDGNNDFISDALIKDVFDKSGKNTRLFLAALEDVCRHAVSTGQKKVTKDDLKVL